LADGIGNGDAGEICGDEIEDCAGGPDGAAEQAEDVAVHWAAEETAECDGLAHQRLFHEIQIPPEAGKQRAAGEEYGDAVGAESISVREGAGGKRRPQAHQRAGDYADDDAFARGFSVGAEFAVGFAVEDDGDDGAEDAGAQHHYVAASLLDEAEDGADYQRDADGYGEGDGESGHVNRGDEQKIGQVENYSGEEGPADVREVGGVDIIKEAGGAASGGAHGEGVDQSGEENSDGVVPVEELEAIIFYAFVGVGPGAPTGGGDEHHQQGGAEGCWCEH